MNADPMPPPLCPRCQVQFVYIHTTKDGWAIHRCPKLDCTIQFERRITPNPNHHHPHYHPHQIHHHAHLEESP